MDRCNCGGDGVADEADWEELLDRMYRYTESDASGRLNDLVEL